MRKLYQIDHYLRSIFVRFTENNRTYVAEFDRDEFLFDVLDLIELCLDIEMEYYSDYVLRKGAIIVEGNSYISKERIEYNSSEDALSIYEEYWKKVEELVNTLNEKQFNETGWVAGTKHA